MGGNPTSLKIQTEQDEHTEITKQNIFKQVDLEAIWL